MFCSSQIITQLIRPKEETPNHKVAKANAVLQILFPCIGTFLSLVFSSIGSNVVPPPPSLFATRFGGFKGLFFVATASNDWSLSRQVITAFSWGRFRRPEREKKCFILDNSDIAKIGGNLLKTFQSRGPTQLRNNALCLIKTCPMTYNVQSGCFISEWSDYTTMKYFLRIASWIF